MNKCKLEKKTGNKKEAGKLVPASQTLFYLGNNYTAPCASIASATLTNPPIFAPFT